jgi:hypothetical protein
VVVGKTRRACPPAKVMDLFVVGDEVFLVLVEAELGSVVKIIEVSLAS